MYTDSYDVTGSKSLTDLADLPAPMMQKKTGAAAAVKGFDDSGIDDWNFDDVKDTPPSTTNKFNNALSPTKSPGKWSPPKPTGKLIDQNQTKAPSPKYSIPEEPSPWTNAPKE